MDHFLGVVAALWIATTILCQFPLSISRKLCQSSIAPLLPNWRFFAPHPITSDYHLLSRHRTRENITEWKETLIVHPHHWSNAIWHPTSYFQQTIVTCLAMIIESGIEGRYASNRTTEAWGIVLEVIRTSSSHKDITWIQFMIVRTGINSTNPEIVFVSPTESMSCEFQVY